MGREGDALVVRIAVAADTGSRQGWSHLAPGLGDRKDPGPWPAVRMEP